MIGERILDFINREPGPAREVDSAAQTQSYGILALGGFAALIMGTFLGLLVFGNPVLGFFLLGIPFAIGIWKWTNFVVNRTGDAAGGLFAPTGHPTPYDGQLSQEETLIVRGMYDEAAEALAARFKDHPNDPRPPHRLAELYRDEMKQPGKAVIWFKRAAAVPGTSHETKRTVLRELIEMTRDQLGRPELAAPALRWAAETYAGDRLGYWAKQELRALRSTD